MKRYFKYVILCILFFCTAIMASDTIDNSKSQKLQIEEISSGYKVLDEWNYPGKYSPVNAFDGDLKTCYAEGSRDGIGSIRVIAKLPIEFNKIRITAGYFKNESVYKLNNRCKEITVYLFNETTNEKEIFMAKNLLYKKTFILNDQFKYQLLNFEKSYKTKYIILSCSEQYKGTKYNDTCISEIEFYYKGKKILFENKNNIRREYLKQITRKLRSMFTNKTYSVGDKEGIIKVFKNGKMKYIRDEDLVLFIPPTAWKIYNAKLYFKIKGKWKLVEYYRVDRDTIIIEKVGGVEYNRGFYPLWY